MQVRKRDVIKIFPKIYASPTPRCVFEKLSNTKEHEYSKPVQKAYSRWRLIKQWNIVNIRIPLPCCYDNPSQLCLVTQFICEANKSRAEFILINFLTRNCVYPFPDPHRSPIKIVLTPLTPVGKRGKGIQSSGSLKWPVRSDLTDRLDKHTSY